VLASDKKPDEINKLSLIGLGKIDEPDSFSLGRQSFDDFVHYVSCLYANGKIGREAFRVLIRQAYALYIENKVEQKIQQKLKPKFDRILRS